MSYEKPTKKCQDATFGFRTVKELAANQDDTKALLEIEHVPQLEQPQFASGFGGFEGSPVHQVGGVGLDYVNGGQHDTPKVARGSLRVEFSAPFAVASEDYFATFKSGVCTGFTRLGVGSYFVPIGGLSDFCADAWPSEAYTTAARLVEQTPTSVGTAPGIYVSTWEETALLGFQLTDFAFNLVVYGFRSGAAAAPVAVARRPPTFSPGPMFLFPSRRR